MILRHRRGIWLGVAAIAAAALIAACGDNPNDDVEVDEFLREAPSAPADVAPAAAAPTEAAPTEAAPTEADASEAPEPTDQPAAPEADQPDDQPEAAAPPADEEPPANEEPATGADGADAAPPDSEPPLDPDDIDLAEDIVRRYQNATYGYSLELICEPFCNVNSAGIDQVGFRSDTIRALITIAVRAADEENPPALAELEEIWRRERELDESFAILEREEIVLAADGVSPALILDWEFDRTSAGGVQERWRSLIVQVGPIAYFVNAGSIAESFTEVEPFFQQSLDSFLARRNPASAPGLYSKWEFVFPYNLDSFNGELGNPGRLPSFEAGLFFQQAGTGQTELVLAWDTVSEDVFDPEAALTEALAPPQDAQIEERERSDLTAGEDITGRFAIATLTDAEGVSSEVGVFVWYCRSRGRSFVLQSFSAENAQAQAQPSLDAFRCASS